MPRYPTGAVENQPQTDMDWTRAACRDKPGRWWFPERGGRVDTYAKARAVCLGCSIRAECLAFALATESTWLANRHGMWGGLNPGERQNLARKVAS